MIFISSAALEIGAPSTESLVASITLIKRGNSIGNDSTGYNVPLEFALEMIAAMNVEAEASPKLPSKIVIRKIMGVWIVKLGIVNR